MNNVSGGQFVAEGVYSPKLLLNCYPDITGRLIKRPGCTRSLALTSGASIFGGRKVMLWAAGATQHLYRAKTTAAISSATDLGVTGTTNTLTYCEIGDRVYIATTDKLWVSEYSSNTLRTWGQAAPTTAPTLADRAVAGDLPSGSYKVVFTKAASGTNPISPPSGVGDIRLGEEGYGILLTGRAAGDLVWVTEPNGEIYYLVGATDYITEIPKTQVSLPTLECITPPYIGGSNLVYFSGRIWGSVGPNLWFSESFVYEWFRESNFIPFADTITLIAAVQDGMFVSTAKQTWFCEGHKPHEFNIREVGKGAVKGTMPQTHGSFHEESGQQIDTWRHSSLLPTWMDSNGRWVQGSQNGRVVELTPQIRMDPTTGSGAALWRLSGGEGQYLVTMDIPSTTINGETDTLSALTNGYVIGG